jgi:hypothetical protein
MEQISPILDFPIENQVKCGYQDEPEGVFGLGIVYRYFMRQI